VPGATSSLASCWLHQLLSLKEIVALDGVVVDEKLSIVSADTISVCSVKSEIRARSSISAFGSETVRAINGLHLLPNAS
jgi:hypothetical protein